MGIYQRQLSDGPFPREPRLQMARFHRLSRLTQSSTWLETTWLGNRRADLWSQEAWKLAVNAMAS